MGVSTKRESGIERRVCTERPGHDAEGNDGDMLNGEHYIDVSIRRISQFNRFDLIQCSLISSLLCHFLMWSDQNGKFRL